MENIMNLPTKEKLKRICEPIIKCVTPKKIFLKAEDDSEEKEEQDLNCSPCCSPCAPCYPNTQEYDSGEDICYPACSPCYPCYPCNPVEEFNERYK